jgi:hypothetical protein
MTVYRSSTNHRLLSPSTQDGSITGRAISKSMVPIHAAVCPLTPKKHVHRSSANKRFPSCEDRARATLPPMLPDLDDVPTLSLPAMPSLKLKPRPSSQTGRTKMALKKPAPLLSKPSSHNITRPVSSTFHLTDDRHALRERNNVLPNTMIVGRSLMRMKLIDHSRTIGKQAVTLEARRSGSNRLCEVPSKIMLMPRKAPSSLSFNKENVACGDLPYLCLG